MCGIFGINDATANIDPDLLLRMSDVMRHRGPDDRGFFTDGGFGFGMNRLSIIDVSSGHQPIGNEDGTLVIVFNGEIYNFQELRDPLAARGHRFTTRSDTETILHLYEEEGTAAFSALRGMFAIALWDSRRRKLVLCRDRLGKKPLYYYHNDGLFLFASEIKSLLMHDRVPRKVDLCALDLYLAHQYVPGPLTIFEGIRKLEPGTYLELDAAGLRTGRYWDLPAYTADVRDEVEAVSRVRELLLAAVQERLVSEVPLGAYLSGGLDSSTIVALMAEVASSPVKTFSVGFAEEGYSELEFARSVAGKFATDHHEIVVKADAADLLPAVVWHLDEPMADPAAIPTYLISEYARRYVTVVLTGEGGDEAFAGYSIYRYQRLAQQYQHAFPAVVRRAVDSLAGRGLFDRKISQGIRALNAPLECQGAVWRSVFSRAERMALYGETVARALQESDAESPMAEAYRTGSGSFLEKMLRTDMKIWLPDDLLMKVDKMSMAHSLEARAPFLDHRLIEFLARVPDGLKLRGKEGKYLLKKAMEGILPHDIIYRRKHGFDVPVDRWLRDDLKGMVDTLLSKKRILAAGFFDPDAVRALVERQRRGDRWYHKQVWLLLVFQIWHERFFGA